MYLFFLYLHLGSIHTNVMVSGRMENSVALQIWATVKIWPKRQCFGLGLPEHNGGIQGKIEQHTYNTLGNKSATCESVWQKADCSL